MSADRTSSTGTPSTGDPRGRSQRSPRRTPTGPEGTAPQEPPAPPLPVKAAGWMALVEGVVGLLFAVYLVIAQASGFHDDNVQIAGAGSEAWGYGYGTAIWFIVIGGFVAAAGWALARGRRWGRAPVTMVHVILLLIAYYMVKSSRWDLAVPTAVIAVAGLALLFNPVSVEWAARRFRDRR
ncbi:hypothetical protein [Corynebacterium bovis]|nr:hypothetical protein [Corynebacterium bovis]MDN8579767.1 hypothetical protein [Corynebacterium bovis]